MKTFTSNDLLLKAIQYATLDGFSVMPVGSDKRPLLREWKELQSRKMSEAELKILWKRFPNANIGIITGKISGITVIDIDSYKGDTSAANAFPPTFNVKTGNGGLQLYYQYQPGFTISAGQFPQYPHVDLRSDGGYVVAAPSITSYKDKDNAPRGGAYEIIDPRPFSPFPVHLFASAAKPQRTLTSRTAVSAGARNDSIASVIGTLLRPLKKNKYESDAWPAIQAINKTYTPPLPDNELRTTFDSIVSKELQRKARKSSPPILSPVQITPQEKVSLTIRTTSNGAPYKDMANVAIVLNTHPDYAGKLRYNAFKHEIEINHTALEDSHVTQIQHFMQTKIGLHGISADAVHSGIVHVAHQNEYDEAQYWLTTLQWDATPRLANWLATSLHVEDTSYHRGVGAEWLMACVKRIMEPGCIFDHALVLIGPQGIGKTSFFRILGGEWYKSYTGAIDNKDFYLALRGAIIMDLDEGSTLSRSDTIKLKSILTETHDEYRAPYDRMVKKYPRRFVFSMSTNDVEPFQDATGNRRYWTVDFSKRVDFTWLEKNRDQLFAEAYHCWKNKIDIPRVPVDIASQMQEKHFQEDSWTELVMEQLHKNIFYTGAKPDFFITVPILYGELFGADKLDRLGKREQIRLATILKHSAGLVRKTERIEDKLMKIWRLSPEKIAELQEIKPKKALDPFNDVF